ncbi:MAG TPA: CocE/NonD family hydrolase, partial [Rhodothermia bacterium]|nr:CocE/NonD family hydrolase [Rhodothermia bacterium]
QAYPFLIRKTPYGSGPYEPGVYRNDLGPEGSYRFAEEGYIFVYQDVRGRFMSEGTFLNVTPHQVVKDGPEDVDESSDMYDTVEWLLANVHPNNGKVGIWGISYPGFYVSASIVDSHPAIAAASPQAAVTDWFIGDDFHHNGAFFLQDGFNFFPWFESTGPNPTSSFGERFDFGSTNAYEFYLNMGPLSNANERYLQHKVAFWDSLMEHGTYDTFWKRRTIIPHLKNVNTAVLNVGGFFDAEDPYGPIAVYHSIEEKNPGIQNTLVMGPWFHGGWTRTAGDHLGNVSFGQATSTYYQENVDLNFFNYYLKGKGSLDLPEVLAYCTGSNDWHRFDAWPPADTDEVSIFLSAGRKLVYENPADAGEAYDEYVSDQANPVPYTQETRIDRSREYMVEDQRFAAARPDVLVYESDVLTEDFSLAGPVNVELFVSTTGTDADFVVKLIDVFPGDEQEWQDTSAKHLDVPMAGYQMMVRGEVFRGKFRNSFEVPEPMVPGEVTRIAFAAPDILHTFKVGHRIMIQIQSSWFPLVDRNPQTFTDIYSATAGDFQPATHRVYSGADHASSIQVKRLKAPAGQ